MTAYTRAVSQLLPSEVPKILRDAAEFMREPPADPELRRPRALRQWRVLGEFLPRLARQPTFCSVVSDGSADEENWTTRVYRDFLTPGDSLWWASFLTDIHIDPWLRLRPAALRF